MKHILEQSSKLFEDKQEPKPINDRNELEVLYRTKSGTQLTKEDQELTCRDATGTISTWPDRALRCDAAY